MAEACRVCGLGPVRRLWRCWDTGTMKTITLRCPSCGATFQERADTPLQVYRFTCGECGYEADGEQFDGRDDG